MKNLLLRPDLQIPLVLCGLLPHAGKADAVKAAVSLLGGNRKAGDGIHDDPPLIRIFRLDQIETLSLLSGEPDISARRRHLCTGFQCIFQEIVENDPQIISFVPTGCGIVKICFQGDPRAQCMPALLIQDHIRYRISCLDGRIGNAQILVGLPEILSDLFIAAMMCRPWSV